MSTRKRPFEFSPNTDRQKFLRFEVDKEAQGQDLENKNNTFGSPSASPSRKRKPETESTGAGPLTKKLRSSPPNPQDRAKFYIRLGSVLDWPHFCELFNAISKRDEFAIALALNDSPQWARLRALKQLKDDVRSRILHNIFKIQLDRDDLDPKSLFPCVATKEYMGSLPSSAQTCNICQDPMKEGFDFIWKPCGKHVLHPECLGANIGQAPLSAVCSCVLDS